MKTIQSRGASLLQSFRNVPLALRIVAGLMLLGVGVLMIAAWFMAEGKTGYDFTKDVLVPLFSPIVAIFVPTLLLYVIPLLQLQQRAALDLFNSFCSEEMRHARNEAWVYFIIERRKLQPAEQESRLLDFLRHLFDREGQRAVTSDRHEIYQKTSRVLEFFAMVNACVQRGNVDRSMVRSFLAFYYLWWRDEIMQPMRNVFPLLNIESRYKPVWWEEMEALEELAQG